MSHFKWSARILASLLVATVLLSGLAACGPTPTPVPPTAMPAAKPTTPPPTATPAPAGPVVIRVSSWSNSTEELGIYQQIAQAFYQKYPNIVVKIESIPDYNTKLLTLIAGGQAPDVMLIGPEWFQDYAKRDAFRPLDDFIARDKFDASDIAPGLLNMGKYGGKQYGLNKDYTTLVIYYNKKLFDAAGLPYPSDGWTWDTFKSYACKLTKKEGGKITQWGYGADVTWWGMWMPFAYLNGGKFWSSETLGTINFGPDTKATLTDAKTAEGIQKYADLALKDGCAVLRPGAEGAGGLFKSGKLAMALWGRWMTREMRNTPGLDWDVAPLPAGAQKANMILSALWTISKNSQHPEEAWKFIQFFLSPEAQKINAANGQAIPALTSLARSEFFLTPGQAPAHSEVYLDVVKDSYLMPVVPNFREIDATWGPAIDEILAGKKTAAQAFVAINDKITTILHQK
ncbi:MAG: sugar ABC transporter substrate-binding protein [Chloroflexi bacterium]|nr:sugar ABC transporter substrate-binding protein [Chloroflexota bacterium]